MTGLSNGSQDAFKSAIAGAGRGGTVSERVAVHTIHQQDSPRSDFTAERILTEAGFNPSILEEIFAREVIKKLETTVRQTPGRNIRSIPACSQSYTS